MTYLASIGITNAVLACIPVQRMDMGKTDDSKTKTIFT